LEIRNQAICGGLVCQLSCAEDRVLDVGLENCFEKSLGFRFKELQNLKSPNFVLCVFFNFLQCDAHRI